MINFLKENLGFIFSLALFIALVNIPPRESEESIENKEKIINKKVQRINKNKFEKCWGGVVYYIVEFEGLRSGYLAITPKVNSETLEFEKCTEQ
ncbi:hypothetical protein CSB11_00570 [Candidatus Campbellbacteria bacterium]|nr:MAG: hypothetical protein CSB11_00570 [Candidatus Campbellbacteria bacterium]